MSIQGISVVVDGEPVHAEALDLIAGILLLRIAGARPVARGERIEASVLMPGSGALAGTMIGIDGPLVRFEPGGGYEETGTEGIAPGSPAMPAGSAGSAGSADPLAPAPPAAGGPSLGAAGGLPTTVLPPVRSVIGSRRAATPAASTLQPAAPGLSPVTVQPVSSRPATPRPAPSRPAAPRPVPPRTAAPNTPPAVSRPAAARRLEERAPARVNRAILADALLLATGRNEVPKRIALLDISTAGGVVRGLDVSQGRKIMLRFELSDGTKLRVLAIAGVLSPAGLTVSFQFDSPQARQRLGDAIATKSLRSVV